jgi:hypothetical protein
VASTWEKYTSRIDAITSITREEDFLLIEGHGPDVSSTIKLYTKDVDSLWFSIKTAQNAEVLRNLREDNKLRIKK